MPLVSRLTGLLALVCPALSAAPLLWGAIRWDAYYNRSSDPSDPAQIVARMLRPPRFHDRLPFFSFIDPVSGNVTFDENSPAVVDEEIALAVGAGLDHWAFDVYPPDTLLAGSLAAYLASTSPLKAQLFFCLLLQSSWMTQGGLAAWPDKVALYSAHFARPSYRLVLGDRPLVYLFSVEEGAWGNASAGWGDWAFALRTLNAASVAAGRGLPYYAIQTWSPADGAAQAAAINAAGGGAPIVEALSAYALGGATDAGTPFTVFANETADFWSGLAATGFHVLPPIAAGWDQAPRVALPPPWVPHPDPAFVIMPTPEELGALVARARDWTLAHAASNPAGVHLVSAWNECGFYLSPFLPLRSAQ